MTSRFLSFVALAGMLVAAGCSGGGGAGTSSLTPTAPAPVGGGSSPLGSNGSIQATFLLPASAAKLANASSSSRTPAYVSPGTTGLQVLLGNGSVNNTGGASGNAQLIQTVNGGAALTNAAGAVTVQLTPGSFNASPVVGQVLQFQNTSTGVINGGVAGCAAAGAIVANASPAYYTQCTGAGLAANGPLQFTVTNVQANGSLLTGTITAASLATSPSTAGTIVAANTLVTFNAASSNGQAFIVGTAATPASPASGSTFAVPTSVFGANTSTTATVSYAPSAQSGYFAVTVTVSNLKAQAGYVMGIVTSDVNNKNFVLAEGQTGALTVPASGPVTANLTLNPVVNSFVMATPVLVNTEVSNTYNNGLGAGNASTSTYQTTLFAVDELGYVIPNQINAVTTAGTIFSATPIVPDNTTTTNMVSIAGTGLTFGYWADATNALVGVTPLVNPYTAQAAATTPVLTLAAAPSAAATANNAAAATFGGTTGLVANAIGNYFQFSLPTAPGITGLTGLAANTTAIKTNVAFGGNPLNVQCATATGVTNVTGTLTSTNNNTVTGYTYTPGTNFPANTGSVTLGTVNCTPGLAGQVN